MSVGIFRSRIFAAGRAFLRDGRGVSAVETAFAFPVILAAFFIIVEFANMALTIQVGESAVSSALLRFRDAGELGASAENDIRQGIAAYSFGYLKPSNVSRVTVEAYESLDALGNPGGTNGAGEDDEEGRRSGQQLSRLEGGRRDLQGLHYAASAPHSDEPQRFHLSLRTRHRLLPPH